MKVLLQRVTQAAVEIDGQRVGAIGQGLLLLVGVEKGDTTAQVERMATKLLNYRIFSDAAEKMNLSVSDIAGELLVVSQFTLAASTHKGRRPSFSSAAAPAVAAKLCELLVEHLKRSELTVQSGLFGANMQVNLVNDGPVTFLLET